MTTRAPQTPIEHALIGLVPVTPESSKLWNMVIQWDDRLRVQLWKIARFLLSLLEFIYLADVFRFIGRQFVRYSDWVWSFPWRASLYKATAFFVVIWKRFFECIWSLYFVYLRSILRLWLFSMLTTLLFMLYTQGTKSGNVTCHLTWFGSSQEYCVATMEAAHSLSWILALVAWSPIVVPLALVYLLGTNVPDAISWFQEYGCVPLRMLSFLFNRVYHEVLMVVLKDIFDGTIVVCEWVFVPIIKFIYLLAQMGYVAIEAIVGTIVVGIPAIFTIGAWTSGVTVVRSAFLSLTVGTANNTTTL